jgi:hypothetical protein
MKRGTLWLIGISTALLTVIGLSATVGKHHWKDYRHYGNGHHCSFNDGTEKTKTDSKK